MAIRNGANIRGIALVSVWGLAFGTIPVTWSTWFARAMSDEAESGGGLIYAFSGVTVVFVTGGTLMLAMSAVIFASRPTKP